MKCRHHAYARFRLLQVHSLGARLRGLLGRARPPGRRIGVWLFPCWAVHTVGMRYPIDVAFVGRDGSVRRLVRHLKPNRMALCLGAQSVVEFAVNTVDSELRYRRRLRVAIGRASGRRSSFVPLE